MDKTVVSIVANATHQFAVGFFKSPHTDAIFPYIAQRLLELEAIASAEGNTHIVVFHIPPDKDLHPDLAELRQQLSHVTVISSQHAIPDIIATLEKKQTTHGHIKEFHLFGMQTSKHIPEIIHYLGVRFMGIKKFVYRNGTSDLVLFEHNKAIADLARRFKLTIVEDDDHE